MPGQRRILLVDDEPHVRNVMQLKLRSAGYETQTASDGEDGFAAANEFKPDLIISDYQMPRLNGLEMCRRLGSDENLRNIPIILLTSREFEIGDKEKAGTNIKAVRDKPFSPKHILKLVEDLLGQPKPVAT